MTQHHSVPDPDDLVRQMEEESAEPDKTHIVSPETTLVIDVQGTQQRWQGTFVYKVPTIGDRIAIGRLKSTYLPSGGQADATALMFAEMVSYLAITLQKKPDWWKPTQFYDEAPLAVVYGRALEYERKFHGRDEVDQALHVGNSASGDNGEESGAGGESDVGRKIQPPAKRSETIVSNTKGGA